MPKVYFFFLANAKLTSNRSDKMKNEERPKHAMI